MAKLEYLAVPDTIINNNHHHPILLIMIGFLRPLRNFCNFDTRNCLPLLDLYLENVVNVLLLPSKGWFQILMIIYNRFCSLPYWKESLLIIYQQYLIGFWLLRVELDNEETEENLYRRMRYRLAEWEGPESENSFRLMIFLSASSLISHLPIHSVTRFGSVSPLGQILELLSKKLTVF